MLELLRSSRCVSSNDPAPVPRSGWSSNACQASFHHCQRLVELIVVRRRGPMVSAEFVGACVKSRNQLLRLRLHRDDGDRGREADREHGESRAAASRRRRGSIVPRSSASVAR